MQHQAEAEPVGTGCGASIIEAMTSCGMIHGLAKRVGDGYVYIAKGGAMVDEV